LPTTFHLKQGFAVRSQRGGAVANACPRVPVGRLSENAECHPVAILGHSENVEGRPVITFCHSANAEGRPVVTFYHSANTERHFSTIFRH